MEIMLKSKRFVRCIIDQSIFSHMAQVQIVSIFIWFWLLLFYSGLATFLKSSAQSSMLIVCDYCTFLQRGQFFIFFYFFYFYVLMVCYYYH